MPETLPVCYTRARPQSTPQQPPHAQFPPTHGHQSHTRGAALSESATAHSCSGSSRLGAGSFSADDCCRVGGGARIHCAAEPTPMCSHCTTRHELTRQHVAQQRQCCCTGLRTTRVRLCAVACCVWLRSAVVAVILTLCAPQLTCIALLSCLPSWQRRLAAGAQGPQW